MRRAACLALAALFAPAASVVAHDRSVSYSEWRIDGKEASVRLRIAALDASSIAAEAAPDETAAEYFSRRLTLSAGGGPCRISAPPRALAPGDWLSFEWTLACANAVDLSIESRILAAVAPGHLHFLRLSGESGIVDRVLTADAPRWSVATNAETSTPVIGLGDAVALGVVHVVGGLDHVAFLAALVVATSSLAGILATATAFTIGHSLTLALAALGRVVPDAAAIEPLIGLSIALVAAENLLLAATGQASRGVALALGALALLAGLGIGSVPATSLLGLALLVPATARLAAERRGLGRSAVAFLFGLIHGFGFAGALADADLAGHALVAALFGFNLGVEIGQVTVVLMIAATLALVRRKSACLHAFVDREASVLLLALGVAWFVVRAY